MPVMKAMSAMAACIVSAAFLAAPALAHETDAPHAHAEVGALTIAAVICFVCIVWLWRGALRSPPASERRYD